MKKRPDIKDWILKAEQDYQTIGGVALLRRSLVIRN